MKFFRSLIPAILCIGAMFAADKPLHLDVLAVGNSYDRNMEKQFPQWVKNSGKGHSLHLQVIYMGGGSLEEHCQSVDELSGVAPAKHGKTRQQEIPLLAALNQRNWDYVTLHQVSWKAFLPKTYEPFLSRLANLVHREAPEARIALYQTWSYRFDHDLYRNNPKLTPENVQQKVIETYEALSARYKFPVIPVGEVFARVLKERPCSRDPNFDYKNPPAGALPNEQNSLHVGAFLFHNKQLRMDPSHAGKVGEYLIGGVWYAVLYDEKASDNPYRPDFISEDDARYYKRVIDEVVGNRRLAPPEPKTTDKPKKDYSAQIEALKKLKLKR